MFSGIVQTTARIVKLDKQVDFMSYTVALATEHAQNLELGASVANNGCCLSVTSIEEFEQNSVSGLTQKLFEKELADKVLVSFDLISSTLEHTNLGLVSLGSSLNIERSFTFGSEVGGHILSGHIFDTVEIVNIEKDAFNYRIDFACSKKWQDYIFDKGFLALDGMSLTVSQVFANDNGLISSRFLQGEYFCFSVNLIPDTLARTTIATKGLFSLVNLELDNNTIITVDTIKKFLESRNLQLKC